jgi:RNA polymerase sigma factor (TIGR02999 family)
MTDLHQGDITRILAGAAGLSREEALERLVPLVYDELRVIARSRLRDERPDHTLQTTDLVHEAWARMAGDRNPPWNDRGHFFRAAAEAMRRILIDHARTRTRVKRGGGAIPVELLETDRVTWPDPDIVLALDEAIRRLAEQAPRAADVVKLRYFAGLGIEETARALELSERTVKREWTFARAWLLDALRDGTD